VDEVVGREHELAAVEEFLASALGAVDALLLEGEARIGKTMLWKAAVQEAGSGASVS
jgi:hypothetical protein